MRPFARFTSWALAGSVALAPALASGEEAVKPYPACDRTPTDAEVTAAQNAFQVGNASFNEADYDRAIDYWEDAYRRDCTAHRLLLNLARAYESNGQKQHAVNALQTYLARSPGSPDESQIQRRIEKLEEQIKAESAAPPPQGGTGQATPPGPAKPAGTAAPQPGEAPAPEPAAPAQGKRSIVPLVVAGAGGAIFVASGIVYLGASHDISKAENACPSRKGCDPAVTDAGNSARTRANISGGFAIGGIALIGGGLAWYFLQKPETQQTGSAPHGFRAAVVPAVGYGYGGVEVAGAF